MDENDTASLDLEFKRYLQLLRPYLGQLVEERVIKLCDAWIQRLSECKEHEKALRNKYVFVLCYQLARGILDAPFLGYPPQTLQPLPDDINSDDSSTEVDYIVLDVNEAATKVLYNKNQIILSETDYNTSQDEVTWIGSHSKRPTSTEGSESSSKNSYIKKEPAKNNECKLQDGQYEIRATNLVKKLREIKEQNILLHRELNSLKEESKSTRDDFTEDYIIRIDNKTSPSERHHDSSATLKSLKSQLQEIQESRNVLIQTISNLQDQLDNFNELKKNQLQDIEAKHKLELIKVRTEARDETKSVYEKKIEELKQTYDDTLKNIQENATKELAITLKSKDEILIEKNKFLEEKTREIESLKSQLDAQKVNLQSMMNKIFERTTDEVSCDVLKNKNLMLEKRVNKLEKAKVKCVKVYEARVAQLQREKHLAECSLQLQLVKQRAQIISELTDENQAELNASLEKLENKYKSIVANVQATAIQKRMQDTRALECILQAACGIDDPNQSQYSNQVRNHNQSYDTENSSLSRGNRVGHVVVGSKPCDNSVGFCLNGERMGELFEKVYIPQRDNCNGEPK